MTTENDIAQLSPELEKRENLRSTVCNAFDFNEIRLSNAKEVKISIDILCIPPFYESQTVDSSLMFVSKSFHRILQENRLAEIISSLKKLSSANMMSLT